jgi:hypothetical protein
MKGITVVDVHQQKLLPPLRFGHRSIQPLPNVLASSRLLILPCEHITTESKIMVL